MKVNNASLWLERKSSKAVLLFHGLAGSSWDVRGLADHLYQRGFSVYAPTLSFHQTRQLRDLEKSNLKTWKQDAIKAYKKVCHFKKVFVVGFSNGSLLGSFLCLNYQVSGLVIICPPIFLGPYLLKLLPQEKVLRWISKKFKYLPRFDYDIVKDQHLVKYFNTYKKLPTFFYYHIFLLAKYVRKNLFKIKCPCLIIQAKHDIRVSPKSARVVFKEIGSEKKELFYAKESGHAVLLDTDRFLIFRKIAGFIKDN